MEKGMFDGGGRRGCQISFDNQLVLWAILIVKLKKKIKKQACPWGKSLFSNEGTFIFSMEIVYFLKWKSSWKE